MTEDEQKNTGTQKTVDVIIETIFVHGDDWLSIVLLRDIDSEPGKSLHIGFCMNGQNHMVFPLAPMGKALTEFLARATMLYVKLNDSDLNEMDMKQLMQQVEHDIHERMETLNQYESSKAQKKSSNEFNDPMIR